MKYRELGRTGVNVSQLCLGSMTWGTQNSEDEAHRQIDLALDAGVNFIDTAEMYPTTPRSTDTQGRTEEIIGSWFASRGRRGDVVLGTKVTGSGYEIVRGGEPISPRTIRAALDGSLERLRTDYVDLYQIHWPNRGSYHFRQNWNYDPSGQDRAATRDHIGECLRTLDELVRAGKIRYVGVSNETCWGVGQYLDIASAEGLPRIVSIQNEYSLLCRQFDLDLAETSCNEDVGLLAFSPLATGILSGKYRGGVVPEGSRRSIYPDLGGRYHERMTPAADAYLEVAARHGLDPARMALAFCLGRPFMTAAIFGATREDHLANALASVDLELDQEVLAEIDAVHRRFPVPL